MIARRAKRRVSVKLVRTVVVPMCAALCAALLAHVALDAVGDVWLARDAYDHVAHASRGIVAWCAFALLAVSLALAFAAAIRNARGCERRFCATLQAAAPNDPARFVVAVTPLAAGVLLAMGILDASLAGSMTWNVADLLGGSIFLGATVVVMCGTAVALVAQAALGRAARLCDAVVRAIVAFAARRMSPRTSASRTGRAVPALAARAARERRNIADRAPPAPFIAPARH